MSLFFSSFFLLLDQCLGDVEVEIDQEAEVTQEAGK